MVGIQIKGLFGHFNYDINLAEGGMTILTGPNGFGKSTIIKCIRALRNSDVEFFMELEFTSLKIKTKDSKSDVVIEKKEDLLYFNTIEISKRDIFYWKRGGRYGKEAVRNRSGSVEITDDMVGRIRIYTDTDEPELRHKIRKVLMLMQQAVGEVICIEEQRLIHVARIRGLRKPEENYSINRENINVVDEIPAKLSHEMQRVANEYSRVANELDSTYPERLFGQKEGMSEEEFEKKLLLMQEKVEKLSKYRISNISKLNQIGFQAEYSKALKVYFEDFERKYQEYAPLMEKLDLLTDMVNRRFKFKKIVLSNENGIVVMDDNGKKLKMSKLSSGEQEILVLFYTLLFEVKDGVMLLVDEPEISLHISWQRMFAEDLKKIVEQKKITAIVATHSPQIVNGNRRIQRDLGALYAEGLNQR